MEKERGLCCLSIVAVKAEGRESSEMVTQLLFGDHYTVLAASAAGDWLQIRIFFDAYEGWISAKQHHQISEAYFQALSRQSEAVFSEHAATETYAGQASEGLSHLGAEASHSERKNRRPYQVCGEICSSIQFNQQPLQIVYGSLLLQRMQEVLGTDEEVKFEGKYLDVRKIRDFEVLKKIAFQYINSPYLWGGKTPFGIDCSGFVQMVFKLCGFQLKRDASQQALQGMPIHALQQARAGDLAFFDNAQGKIVHVGILLEDGQIIHASGKVRIDELEEKGIFNRENGIYTHKLCLIKRYIT